jgi:hypothetical protein
LSHARTHLDTVGSVYFFDIVFLQMFLVVGKLFALGKVYLEVLILAGVLVVKI